MQGLPRMLSRKPATISLALIVCLTFVTAAGVARPVKEPFTSGRHSHTVLAPRHGHGPRLGARAFGRHEMGLRYAGMPSPPALESRIVRDQDRVVSARMLAGMDARGPPARGSTASYRNAPTPCRDYRSQGAPRSDILFVSGLTLAHSIVPWFPCT